MVVPGAWGPARPRLLDAGRRRGRTANEHRTVASGRFAVCRARTTKSRLGRLALRSARLLTTWAGRLSLTCRHPMLRSGRPDEQPGREDVSCEVAPSPVLERPVEGHATRLGRPTATHNERRLQSEQEHERVEHAPKNDSLPDVRRSPTPVSAVSVIASQSGMAGVQVPTAVSSASVMTTSARTQLVHVLPTAFAIGHYHGSMSHWLAEFRIAAAEGPV